MYIYKLSINRDHLKLLPKNELAFFIQAGSVLNEINVLHKVILVSNRKMLTEVETRAQNYQSLFILSILTGKLYESCRFLERNYFTSKLSRDYHDLLSDVAKTNLDNLKQYFGKENLIKKIRNNLAFHYGTEEIESQIEKMLSDEVPEIYLSENQGNSFYYLSSNIYLRMLLSFTEEAEPFPALDQLFKEVLNVANWFLIFLNHCLVAFSKRYKKITLDKIEIKEPFDIKNVFLPYFIDRTI